VRSRGWSSTISMGSPGQENIRWRESPCAVGSTIFWVRNVSTVGTSWMRPDKGSVLKRITLEQSRIRISPGIGAVRQAPDTEGPREERRKTPPARNSVEGGWRTTVEGRRWCGASASVVQVRLSKVHDGRSGFHMDSIHFQGQWHGGGVKDLFHTAPQSPAQSSRPGERRAPGPSELSIRRELAKATEPQRTGMNAKANDATQDRF
jgi:hypothetical protein